MLRIIILLVALGAGGLAAWLSYRYLDQAQDADATAAAPMSEVLILTQNLPRGSLLAERDLRWQPMPIEAVPDLAITRADSPDGVAAVAGRIARVDLLKGDAIRAASLVEGGAGLMSLVLRPGMRAVGLQVTSDKTAGGFILPDDKVDIIHTIVRDSGGVSSGASRTILTNVRVLAIGTTSAQSSAKNTDTGETLEAGSGVTVFGDTATVEVTPEQAEILNAALQTGELSFSLRAISDFGETAVGVVAGGAVYPPILDAALGNSTEDRTGASVRLFNAGAMTMVSVKD